VTGGCTQANGTLFDFFFRPTFSAVLLATEGTFHNSLYNFWLDEMEKD
jgi:hypothetical protein